MRKITREHSKQALKLQNPSPTVNPEKKSIFAEPEKPKKFLFSGARGSDGGAFASSPKNWPTVWVRDNGQLEHRERTQELLEDYLNKDLSHLKNHQIREYYKKVSEGSLDSSYFKKKVRGSLDQALAHSTLDTNFATEDT